MTRKIAPRAPVCESGTLGGSKDTTLGLKKRQRQTEEKGRREERRRGVCVNSTYCNK